MRLTCDLEIVSRLLPSLNVKKPSKPTHSQISIGKKPGSSGTKDATMLLMVCSAKDRNGSKYLIKGNIEQIFGRFIQEGKTTIRLKNPETDLCLSKADPLQLKNFLSVLRLAAQGKDIQNVTLSTLAPASSKSVEKPKSKMTILTKKDYPLTTNFPFSLEQLQISQCKLKRIDTRIFNLRHLEILNLSDNVMEILPDNFGKLDKLRELYLNINQLTSFPPKLCLQSTIQQSLCLLDLSNNNLKILPLQICELYNLVTLKLDHNALQELPPTVGRMKKLKYLTASNNQLTSLPASFLQLYLDSLDLFSNPFPCETEEHVSVASLGVPSLVECCARSIRKYRIPYSEEDIHTHLCRYIDSARYCWCGGYCYQCCAKYTSIVPLKKFSHTVSAINLTGQTEVPIQSFLCSPQCLSRFQKNPYAYWKKS